MRVDRRDGVAEVVSRAVRATPARAAPLRPRDPPRADQREIREDERRGRRRAGCVRLAPCVFEGARASSERPSRYSACPRAASAWRRQMLGGCSSSTARGPPHRRPRDPWSGGASARGRRRTRASASRSRAFPRASRRTRRRARARAHRRGVPSARGRLLGRARAGDPRRLRPGQRVEPALERRDPPQVQYSRECLVTSSLERGTSRLAIACSIADSTSPSRSNQSAARA